MLDLLLRKAKAYSLLLMQSASELIKRFAFLRGLIPDPLTHSHAGNDSPVATPADNPPPEVR